MLGRNLKSHSDGTQSAASTRLDSNLEGQGIPACGMWKGDSNSAGQGRGERERGGKVKVGGRKRTDCRGYETSLSKAVEGDAIVTGLGLEGDHLRTLVSHSIFSHNLLLQLLLRTARELGITVRLTVGLACSSPSHSNKPTWWISVLWIILLKTPMSQTISNEASRLLTDEPNCPPELEIPETCDDRRAILPDQSVCDTEVMDLTSDNDSVGWPLGLVAVKTWGWI